MMVVAEARGSMRVMWRAEVPAARRLREGRAVRESREWEVRRVSTGVLVGRSQVLRLWSQEEEYATVGSFGAKMVAETGAEWDLRRERGPRWGVDVAGPVFRRFELRDVEEGIRDAGAEGASDFLVDQRPREWSAEAERIRLEGAWTARESMEALWPKSSRWGVSEAEKEEGSSEYFQRWIVRSRLEDAI